MVSLRKDSLPSSRRSVADRSSGVRPWSLVGGVGSSVEVGEEGAVGVVGGGPEQASGSGGISDAVSHELLGELFNRDRGGAGQGAFFGFVGVLEDEEGEEAVAGVGEVEADDALLETQAGVVHPDGDEPWADGLLEGEVTAACGSGGDAGVFGFEGLIQKCEERGGGEG